METAYDVVVVGGGAAGLAGAVALARSRRTVLVVDDGTPRNATAGHVHNYLGRESSPPAELVDTGRAEAAAYGVVFATATVTATGRTEAGFDVQLGDGGRVTARRLLVATGQRDVLPEVPGLTARWGRDVLHCPFCHGYEVRDQAIGVLSTGPMTGHQAHMFRQLSPTVSVLQHTGPEPTEEQRAEYGARGIRIVPGEVIGLEVTDDRLTGVRLADGSTVPLEALVVATRVEARIGFLAALGLEPTVFEMGGHPLGTYLAADPAGQTSVPGVYVAGNVADVRAQVIVSAASGLMVGAQINGDLVAEDVAAAVQRHRSWQHADHSRVFDADFWEERYGGRTAAWSGRPNAVLVDEVSDLAPGTALDVGCGEGGDALWLAQRGWRVTGVDFAGAALARASEQAVRVGVATRTTWVQGDATQWSATTAYDLVTTSFLHLPSARLRPLFARLADAVAPGGTLLVIGHHPNDVHTAMHRPDLDAFFTAEDVAAVLDPADWKVEVCEARPRLAVGPDGHEVRIEDAVLRATRSS